MLFYAGVWKIFSFYLTNWEGYGIIARANVVCPCYQGVLLSGSKNRYSTCVEPQNVPDLYKKQRVNVV
jgi:hypothetical protein